jgi:hypothetical protein
MSLLPSPVEGQIAELELALKLAKTRLEPFEQKYGVTSDYFIAEMTAEDLTGGDDEYVRWAGEYRLRQKLQEKLNALRVDQYAQLMARLAYVAPGRKFSRDEMNERT